ncbi:hypothetical protein AMTRI_Chr04g189280 [Amborella trichopoda]
MWITLGFISSLETAISRSSPNSLMGGVTGAQKEPNKPRPTCHPPYVTSFMEISWLSTLRQRKWMKKPGCCCLYCTRKPWFESWVLGLTQEKKWVEAHHIAGMCDKMSNHGYPQLLAGEVLTFTKSGITLTCDEGGKLSVLDEASCSNLYITIPLCILGSWLTEEDKFTAL